MKRIGVRLVFVSCLRVIRELFVGVAGVAGVRLEDDRAQLLCRMSKKRSRFGRVRAKRIEGPVYMSFEPEACSPQHDGVKLAQQLLLPRVSLC